jgi:hypothetical protein
MPFDDDNPARIDRSSAGSVEVCSARDAKSA